MQGPSPTAHNWEATLGAVMDAAASVLTAESLDQTLDRVAEQLAELVPFNDLAIYEIDRESQLFVPLFAYGTYTAEVMAHTFPLERGITGAAFRAGTVRNVPRSDLDPDAGLVIGTEQTPEAMVSVPLKVAGRTIAMLNVYRPGERAAFSTYEASVIEHFGIIVALALSSARQRELLRSQAETDELTGLLNRRAFDQQFDALLHEARRSSRPLGLVLIDLDHFKQVNDQHGHQAGDAALAAVADALRASVRGRDVVARFGGEEFVVVLPDTAPDASFAIAERARGQVTSHPSVGVRLTVSAGLAGYPDDGAEPDALLRAADAALYDAKRAGRDCARRYGADEHTR